MLVGFTGDLVDGVKVQQSLWRIKPEFMGSAIGAHKGGTLRSLEKFCGNYSWCYLVGQLKDLIFQDSLFGISID